MRSSGLFITTAFILPLLNSCSDESAVSKQEPILAIQQIADGIYVHTGQHVPFDSPDSDDIANIGFIAGDQCVAVIDTGGSISIGRDLKETIKATTDVPICYVINSHVHYDHVLGNLPFKQPGIDFIGHQDLPDALAGSRSYFIEQFSRYLGQHPDQAIIAPDKVVTDSMTLDLGNRPITLTAWRSAHTSNDLTVYDKNTRTLWAADLLFMERIPSLDASLKGWLAVLDELESIPAERVVPGHGPASADWPEAVSAERRYLTRLLDETREAIHSGKFLDKAMDSVASDETDKWQLSDQHHRRNISRAYSELEWE